MAGRFTKARPQRSGTDQSMMESPGIRTDRQRIQTWRDMPFQQRRPLKQQTPNGWFLWIRSLFCQREDPNQLRL